MIDVMAVILILAVVGLGSRYLSEDQEKDSHNIFCLGMCAHVDEHSEEEKHVHDPEDPNDPCEEE